MSPDRQVIKRVTQELVRNPSWKIIVRGNSWLCPFCGEIGARALSMNEEIESKIAQHLTGECERWNDFAGPQMEIEELRRKAKLVVFKIQVGKWILEDRRFSMATDDGRWFCPFCGVLTPITLPESDPRDPLSYGEAPERSPFLTATATHFLQCSAFEREEHKSQQELDELKARTERRARLDGVRERFQREPAWQLADAERNWLCPFCATPTTVALSDQGPDEAFFKGIGEHLLLCRSYQTQRGRPRPVEYLRDRVAALARERRVEALRRKIGTHAVWRCRDTLKRWYCPYCAERTAVPYPESNEKEGEAFDRFTDGVLDHIRRCPNYKAGQAPIREKEEMLQVLQAANLKIKRNGELRRTFDSNPVFAVATEDRTWICPYCIKAADEVELDPEKRYLKDDERFEQLADDVFGHLEGCPGYAPGRLPAATLEALQAEAQQRSSELSGQFQGVSAITSEWSKLKQEVENYKSEDLEPEEAAEASLESARDARRRSRPKLPELPGFEFAVEHRPCETVGGDFYDFFAVNEQIWAVTIGSFAGKGVEAALSLGLAKKLLQVHGRRQRSCVEVLGLVNTDIFNDLDENACVEVFFGFLNVQSHAFQFARAGHKAPLIIYNERREPRLNVFQTRGLALGKDQGQLFSRNMEQMNLQLAPGDVLIQLTEGAVGALNAAQEPFGFERLKALIDEHGKHEPEYMLWRVRKAIEAWRGASSAQEDVTILAFKLV